MKTIKFILVLVMLYSAVLPMSIAIAQVENGVDIPLPVLPHDTILDSTPRYRWTVVEGATAYQYQVWQGSNKVLDRTPASSSCGISFCSKTPDFPLGYFTYKWHVRAIFGSTAGEWSEFLTFSVSPPSFYSSFNGSKTGWKGVGTSIWEVNDSTLYTYSGHAGDYTAIYQSSGMYTDFTYSARFKSKGLALVDQFLVFRAGTKINPSNGDWFPAYVFGITGEYMVGVFEITSTGDYIPIHNWDGLGPLNTGYNTLKVVAKGNNFKCYLNGVLAVEFTDSTLKRGFVGLKSFKDYETNTMFIVDWAMVKVIETPQ